MDVRRTQNPLEFTAHDGIVQTEQSPIPSVTRAGANSVVFLGQFEKGPENDPTYVTNPSEVPGIFGDNQAYSGLKALQLKDWSRLHVVRVVASDSVKASVTQTVSTKDLATFTALYKGKYGNDIKVVIADGTQANTKKVTITLGSIKEVYDNVVTNGKTNAELAEIFRGSQLVVVTDSHSTDNLENANLSLASGDDGSISSTDYQTAINNANINRSGKIYIADDHSAAVSAVLANYVKTNKDGICVLAPSSLTTTVADAITQAENLLDANGRVMFVYNPVRYNIQGVITEESPDYLLASILSLSSPHVSPAAAENRIFTTASVGVKYNLTLAQRIQLLEAGIMNFEDDQTLGVRVTTGVTGSPEWSVVRRRMNDFLLNSLSGYLKYYQNNPNSFANRAYIKAAIIAFDESLVADGILPTQDDSGVPVLLVQTQNTTTAQEQQRGIQKVIYKRRIFTEMRFIVLQTSVGESVTVENLEG